MSFQTEELLDRLRASIGDRLNIHEQRMFDGVVFMLNGNMLCGIAKGGQLMARVGKELEAKAANCLALRIWISRAKKWAACFLSMATAQKTTKISKAGSLSASDLSPRFLPKHQRNQRYLRCSIPLAPQNRINM